MSWCVDPGKRLGTRERFFFATEAEAKGKAEQLRVRLANEGKSSASLSDHQRVEAIKCLQKLSLLGVGLTEAVDYFIKNARPFGGTRKVEEVVEEFLTSKENTNRKESYLSIQRCVLGQVFCREFGERRINELGHEELERWIQSQDWVPRTRLNYFRDISNLIGFAVRKGYCASNPFDRLDKPLVDEKSPGTLTADQARALLLQCQSGEGMMLAPVALGLFAGLRTAELEALEWQWIDLAERTVEVPPHIAKTREGRYVDLSENLVAWLRPIAKSSGLISPPKAFNYHLAVQAKAAGIVPWPKNAMRHTFASCHLAAHKNASLTANQLGHMGSTQTLYRRYFKRTSASEAARFWAIIPKNGGD